MLDFETRRPVVRGGSDPPFVTMWAIAKRGQRIWFKLAPALLTGYFLCFNWGSLRVHIDLDGLGNIDYYYEFSREQLLLSNFTLWRGDVRPLGALFYLPIYHFAGLNPVPYQAAILLLLLVTVYWAYRFMRLLGAGERAAALVALVCCYHGGVANLYYNAAFIFDVLCCFFYLASFVYYLRIRNQGRPIRYRDQKPKDLGGSTCANTFLVI